MELGGRIATASVRTGFAMTGFLQGVRWYAKRSGILFRIPLLLHIIFFAFSVRYEDIAAGGGRRLGQLDQPGLGIEVGGEGGGQGG